MRLISFDTETTGFKPGQICQLSYIVEDNGFTEARNHFFTVQSIEPGATKVHGFTVNRLHDISQGLTFADHAEIILSDFESADLLLAHNFSFDRSFLTAEFYRLGKKLRLGQSLCTMKHFTPICKLPPLKPQQSSALYKYPTLKELSRYLGITDKMVSECSEELFRLSGCLEHHDARFDSTAVYLIYKKAAELCLIDTSLATGVS